MKLNFHPSRVVYLDFETQSQQELTTVSKYVSHPSTQVLSVCVKVDGVMHRFGPYLDGEAKQRLAEITEDRVIVAHNVPFDEAVWTRVAGLPEREWYDTLPCARAAGLPGQLDKLGTVLFGQGKDKNGARLIDMLCKIKNGRVPAVGPAHKLLLDYNERDVELLEGVYLKTRGFREQDVVEADFAINARGVPISRKSVETLIGMYERNSREKGEKFHALTGVSPTSPKQVLDWIQSHGVTLPLSNGKRSINKQAVQEFMADPESCYMGDGDGMDSLDLVKEAIETRKEVARVGASKVATMLELLDDDDRIREQFVYWGTHTGRWSGRKVQFHNLPKPNVDTRELELSFDSVTAASVKAGIPVADVLNSCIRNLVEVDNLLVADYAGVEMRGIAWLADENRMLEYCKDLTKSVYCDMGARVFGRQISKKGDPDEYTIAKALVLGSCYGMSGAKFVYTNKNRGVDMTALEAAGIAPADTVKMYREMYPMIPRVWKAYGEAVHSAVKGVSCEAGKCKFYMVGLDLRMELPSGRCVVYRNAHVEMLVPMYCKLYGMPEVPVPTVVYDGPRHRGFLYGSKVAENCLGASTLVLTDRGAVPIPEITSDDLVWDGEAWVETDGAVCNGEQEVGEWLGVTMTRDHTIFDGKRWVAAIDLDDAATTCSLEWAARLDPYPCSKCSVRSTRSACAVCAKSRRRFRCCGSGRSRMPQYVCGVRTSPEGREFGTGIREEQSYRTIPYGPCGNTGGQGCCRVVTTRNAMPFLTTEDGVYPYAKSGRRITYHSSPTPSRSVGGIIPTSKWTAKTMTGITSQVTFGSSRGLLTPIIAELPCMHGSTEQLCRSGLCTNGTSRFCHGARSMSTSRESVWKESNTSEPVYDLMNCGPRNRFAVLTDGGLAVVHNCCQSLCRDLLALAIVRCERAGLRPIIHVHDEVVCEAPEERLDEFLEIMSDVPPWAKGFPILVEGCSGKMWSKYTKGYTERNALDGRVL